MMKGERSKLKRYDVIKGTCMVKRIEVGEVKNTGS